MSLPPSWRQFQLFDFIPIKDPNYGSDNLLYSDASLSAITASISYLIVCNSSSVVKIIDKNFSILKSFNAYDIDYSVNFAECIPNSNLLVTLAECQGSPAILKLWDLNKLIAGHGDTGDNIDQDDYKHKYHTQVLIHNDDNSYPISCFKFNDSVSCIAIGYTNGKVILVRGDLIRDRGSKQRVVYESNDPITGVQFNNQQDLLYITTTSKILTVLTNGRNQGKPNRILSKTTGVDLNCSDIDKPSSNLIIATQDSIKYYNHISRSHTINFDFPKRRISKIFKNYLLIVSLLDEVNNGNKKQITKVIILDLFNKHISFTLTIPNNSINHIFEWMDDTYLLSKDGTLYKIHEKTINQQIELILQRELFSVATQLASQAKLSSKILLRIEKLHGEYLYEKQVFDESIKSFIKCLSLIDTENTSIEDDDNINDFIMDVITKFKDVSNISNLTDFTYNLYKLKLANNDHLTLLLCCYCKLKMVKELDQFIDDLNFDSDNIAADSENISNDKNNHNDKNNVNLQELNYQLIINLFRECGYFKQVIKLLYKLNQPNLIVEIHLNDLDQPQQVLSYLKTLPIDDLLLILIDHLKNLLDVLPIEVTQLLIKVFTGTYQPEKLNDDLFNDLDDSINNNGNKAKDNKDNENDSSIVLNSYQAFLSYIKAVTTEEDLGEGLKNDNQPTYLPPKPKLIFPSFINNPKEFVIFLEACIETFDKYQGNINDKKDLLITLYELYLSLTSSAENASKNDEKNESLKQEYEYWLNKAKSIISDYSTLLDKSNLLLISHIFNFTEGEIIAKEGTGNFEESLFRSASMSQDVPKCFEILKKFGDSNANLYKLMLKFIISKESIFKQVKESEFKDIIFKLKQLKLTTPLELITILSSNEFITIGIIKDYLIEYIDLQNKETSNNLKLVQSYELESTKNSHNLTELTKKPFIIQNNKCAHCQLRLDFPAIHFKCKHSYHQRCLNENNYISNNEQINNNFEIDLKHCPICIGELDSIQSIRNSHFSAKNNYEIFESQLNDSNDRFKVISDYLGKGLMENESVLLD